MYKRSCLQELQMIALGSHEQIMAYISEVCLCDEAQLALIGRGNVE